MDVEFEKFQEQISKLESQKVSRQKNQATPEYKSLLRKRRQIDEEIMMLEEQKSLITRDDIDVSELIIEINVDYSNQKEKIESDKEAKKISKRTYSKLLKNLSDRYDAKMKSLDNMTEELLKSSKEDNIKSFDEKIQQLREKRIENESEITKLKIANENKNLLIDRDIYYANKEQLKKIERKLEDINDEIEILKSITETEKNENPENSNSKLEKLAKKQALANEYIKQRDELKTRIEKFSKKTLEKISEFEEKEKLNKKAPIQKTNLDEKPKQIGGEKPKKEQAISFAQPINNEIKPKKQEKPETEKTEGIFIQLVTFPTPYLRYSTVGSETKGNVNYTMNSKYANNAMAYTYEDVLEYIEDKTNLDKETLSGVDPFLLDYLNSTNAALYDEVIDELKKGNGLEKFAGIIHYDMTNADELKRSDRRKFKKIRQIAEKSGLEVNAHKKMYSMLEKMLGKKRKNIEISRVELQEKKISKAEKYRKQYIFTAPVKEIGLASGRMMTDPMKFVKGRGRGREIE